MDTACPAHQALPPALPQLHCTHQLSPGLLMPLYHSPINLSPPPTSVSPIHRFNHSNSLLPCPKNSSKSLGTSFFLFYTVRTNDQISSHPTPSWISQSLILQPKSPLPSVPLSLSVSSLRWTLPLAVVLSVESGSLPALPACQKAALTSLETVFLLSALVADLVLGQFILQPWRSPCSVPGWSGTFLTIESSSYRASVTWDLGRFFSRYFLDTKAIILLSVKSPSAWPKDGDTWASQRAVSVFEKHSGFVP